MTSGEELLADAAWWRSEYSRLGRELEHMTPGHAEAIGPAAVRRLQVSHETALQLAQEAEQRLGLAETGSWDGSTDAPTLF